jgi:hypothetical protein
LYHLQKLALCIPPELAPVTVVKSLLRNDSVPDSDKVSLKYEKKRQSKVRRRRRGETKREYHSAGPDRYMGTYQTVTLSDLKYGIGCSTDIL